MCRNENEIRWERWIPYGKHLPPRSWTREDCVGASAEGGISRYFPGIDVQVLEQEAARHGTCIPSGKPATSYKLMAFPDMIGASDGLPSCWMRVESTNGDFHGHPISRRVFDRLMKKAECDDE